MLCSGHTLILTDTLLNFLVLSLKEWTCPGRLLNKNFLLTLLIYTNVIMSVSDQSVNVGDNLETHDGLSVVGASTSAVW